MQNQNFMTKIHVELLSLQLNHFAFKILEERAAKPVSTASD